MKRAVILYVLVGVVIGWFLRSWTADRTAYTLYRNSVTDSTMRIHVATFDASEAERTTTRTVSRRKHSFSSSRK